jgi:hypothetical protein
VASSLPMPIPPTKRFSQLSIGSMPPMTRLQSRMLQEYSSDEFDDGSSDIGLDEDTGEAVFPSKLRYSLSGLDADTRDRVVEAIDVSPLVLQECQAKDSYVIFQVAELSEYSIRTGTTDSPYSTPSCSCEEESPCRHSLW